MAGPSLRISLLFVASGLAIAVAPDPAASVSRQGIAVEGTQVGANTYPRLAQWKKGGNRFRQRKYNLWKMENYYRAETDRLAAEERARREAEIVNDAEPPAVRAVAPKRVYLGDGSFLVKGVVGDGISPPRLTADGARQFLFERGADDPYIAKHTYRFEVEVPVTRAGEKRVILEACDAAANCVTEVVVIEIVAAVPAPPSEARIAELDAEVRKLGARRKIMEFGSTLHSEFCASAPRLESGDTIWTNVEECANYLRAKKRLEVARADRAAALGGAGTAAASAEERALLAQLEAADAERRAAENRALRAEDVARNLAKARARPREQVAADRPNIAARNHALIIGNNDYRRLPNLRSAVGDAKAVAQVLTSRYAFRDDDVTLLLDADRRAILGALEDLRLVLGPDDRLLIYYAGHGQIDPVTEEGFWQPVDAEPDRQFTWIANDDVRRSLKGMPAKHVLVVADSCFSGSLTRGPGAYDSTPKDRFFTEIDASVSRKVISSGGTKPVMDSGSEGHSVFAYYLLKALRENDQPYLAAFALFGKLVRAVANNSSQKPEFGTVQDAGDEGAGDFTFILKSGG